MFRNAAAKIRDSVPVSDPCSYTSVLLSLFSLQQCLSLRHRMYESSGDLAIAVLISRSTDPITTHADGSNAHMRNFKNSTAGSDEKANFSADKSFAPPLVIDPSIPPSEVMLSLLDMTPQQLADVYEKKHPISFNRASVSDNCTKSLLMSNSTEIPHETPDSIWVGNVCGDPPARFKLSQFSAEDFIAPPDDLLFSVGSQIAFEIRMRLFERTGFTTSAG